MFVLDGQDLIGKEITKGMLDAGAKVRVLDKKKNKIQSISKKH